MEAQAKSSQQLGSGIIANLCSYLDQNSVWAAFEGFLNTCGHSKACWNNALYAIEDFWTPSEHLWISRRDSVDCVSYFNFQLYLVTAYWCRSGMDICIDWGNSRTGSVQTTTEAYNTSYFVVDIERPRVGQSAYPTGSYCRKVCLGKWLQFTSSLVVVGHRVPGTNLLSGMKLAFLLHFCCSSV